MPTESPAGISDVLAGPVELAADRPASEVSKQLTQAGRRGKLPGFKGDGGGRFRVDCDAVPFEYELSGEVREAGEGTAVVSVRVSRRPLMPWVFGVTLVLTVWPGVWLTDSLLGVYWSAYAGWSERMPWLTYAWYLPITALPLPWLWRSLTRKSEAMARESGVKLVKTIRDLLSTVEY